MKKYIEANICRRKDRNRVIACNVSDVELDVKDGLYKLSSYKNCSFYVKKNRVHSENSVAHIGRGRNIYLILGFEVKTVKTW